MTKKRSPILAWVVLIIAALYMLVPLYATFEFSLHAKRNQLTLIAYTNVLQSSDFSDSFMFSLRSALLIIVVSAALVVPTIYWVRLKLPGMRPIIEFFTLLPLVIPPVVLAFGLIRAFNQVRINDSLLTDSREGTYVLLLGAYLMLALPFMYRTVDSGMQTINVRVLTEAAQSLGAGWFTILFRIIFPNVIVAVLNGAFITFAIVMGEFTIANLLSQPAFGPYMYQLNSNKVYEPSAVAVISFGLTWLCIILIESLGRRGNSARVTVR